MAAKNPTEDKDVYAKLFTLPTTARDDFPFVDMSRRLLRNLNHVEIEANFLVKQLLKMGSKQFANNQALFQSERAAKMENEKLRNQQSVQQNVIQKQDEVIRAKDERISFMQQELREKEALLVKFRNTYGRSPSAPSSNDSIGGDSIRTHRSQYIDPRRMGSTTQGGILHPPMHSKGILHPGTGILHSNRGILPSVPSIVSGYRDDRSHATHPDHISKRQRLTSPPGGYYLG
jgi:hypothetical protein